jgi:hypothetical protein
LATDWCVVLAHRLTAALDPQLVLQPFHLRYNERPVGNGSFGYVFEARIEGTGQRVAVKKVYQDPGYKNRELPIMQFVGKHPNVVELIAAFRSRSRTVSWRCTCPLAAPPI